jgi:acetoin utilization protein AcuB
MTTNVITVDEEVSLMKASRLMKEKGIKHLPVLKNGRLAGIVSDRDLKEAQPSDATSLDIHEIYYLLEKVKIREVMSTEPYTTTSDEIVERAANVMLEHDISALPVVDKDGNLEGIVTKGDLFHAMIAISGVKQTQLQFGVEIEDRPGAVKEVTDLIRNHAGRVVSITTHHEDAPEGFLNVYIRCKEIENERDLVADLKGRVKILYKTHYKLD